MIIYDGHVVNDIFLYDSFDMICMDNIYIMKILNPSYAINDVIRYVQMFLDSHVHDM